MHEMRMLGRGLRELDAVSTRDLDPNLGNCLPGIREQPVRVVRIRPSLCNGTFEDALPVWVFNNVALPIQLCRIRDLQQA